MMVKVNWYVGRAKECLKRGVTNVELTLEESCSDRFEDVAIRKAKEVIHESLPIGLQALMHGDANIGLHITIARARLKTL